MLKYDTIKSTDEEHLMRTYNRLPALFVQGSGCSLWDNRGNEYLDLLLPSPDVASTNGHSAPEPAVH